MQDSDARSEEVSQPMLGLVVEREAVRRAWRRDGWFCLRLRTGFEPGSAWQILDAAVGAANEEVLESIGGDALGNISVSPAPDGGLIYFDDCDSIQALDLWLDAIVRGLDAGGITGKLVVARDETPELFRRGPVDACCAVMSFRVDFPRLMASRVRTGTYYGWFIDPDMTGRLIDSAVRWCSEGVAGEWWFSRVDTSLRVTQEGLTELIKGSLEGPLPAILRESGTDLFRAVSFAPHGRILFEQGGARTNPSDVFRHLSDLITTHAEWLDYAFVKQSRAPTVDMADLLAAGPRPPKVTPGYASGASARALDATHVPDAFPIQLLTQSHLARLDLDPDRWTVTAADAGRALVAWRDLNGWLDPTTAGECLDAARQDFQSILIDEDLVRRARVDQHRMAGEAQ